jgi:hypothetical protein
VTAPVPKILDAYESTLAEVSPERAARRAARRAAAREEADRA